MTDRWFTDAQVQQVAQDLLEQDRTMADAMDMTPGKPWGELSQEGQQAWLDRATAQLSKIVLLDLSRPIRLRDGTPALNARLSEDGLSIIARVEAWRTDASWPLDGSTGDKEFPEDLVYAAETVPA
jgi:hypothetical protein